MRNTLVLLWWMYLSVLVFLSLLRGATWPKDPNPSPGRLGPPFIEKGVATVAHRRWKGHSDARLSLALHDQAHLMRLAQVSLLYRGRGRALSRPSLLPLASTSALASGARDAM